MRSLPYFTQQRQGDGGLLPDGCNIRPERSAENAIVNDRGSGTLARPCCVASFSLAARHHTLISFRAPAVGTPARPAWDAHADCLLVECCRIRHSAAEDTTVLTDNKSLGPGMLCLLVFSRCIRSTRLPPAVPQPQKRRPGRLPRTPPSWNQRSLGQSRAIGRASQWANPRWYFDANRPRGRLLCILSG